MVVECFDWSIYTPRKLVSGLIGYLTRAGRRDVLFLPDEIIIEILSRVPIDCLMRCGTVCRHWLRLTSTPSFAELHLKRRCGHLQLFVLFYAPEGLRKSQTCLSVIYPAGSDKTRKKKKMSRYTRIARVGHNSRQFIPTCCNDLLLLAKEERAHFYVWNFITGWRRNVPPAPFACRVCAFFVHPWTKKYTILCYGWGERSGTFIYCIHSLGTETWRILSSTTDGYVVPDVIDPHALVKGALHWITHVRASEQEDACACSHAILVFNIDTESFSVWPHPRSDNKCNYDLRTYLFEKEEHLCFCHVYGFHQGIGIFILEDYPNWSSWVKAYHVNLQVLVQQLPHDIRLQSDSKVSLLKIQHEVLVFYWWNFKGIFYYHLKNCTITRRYELPESAYHLRLINPTV